MRLRPILSANPRGSTPSSGRIRRFLFGAVVPLLVAGLLTAGTAPAGAAGVIAPNAPQLGPNVYVFDPGMAQADIQATVDSIASRQVGSEFGTGRYTLLFKPGSYGSASNPLAFQVGYYTEVAGLGNVPGDVRINGTVNVYNQCLNGSGNCLALTNFWRSLANLTINVAGGSGCRAGVNFWAVSQAAPMRRVDVNGNLSLMDYCTDGPQYSSGGFMADTRHRNGTLTSGSQQQFLVRNGQLANWSNGVWNQVFAGTPGAPATSFGVPNGPGPYTNVSTTPVSAERPYLTFTGNAYSVRVPAVKRNSSGTSWAGGLSADRVLPLSDFLVATPATSLSTINDALAAGRHLLLSPGIYRYDAPIRVNRAGAVVLAEGMATIVPKGATPALTVGNVPGVRLAGFTVDAGPATSPQLVQVGTGTCGCGGTSDPIVLSDVFFRVGGPSAGRATTSLEVNASNVLLDHIWAWRADHGAGVGWNGNTADTGVAVNGSDVTALGLFVEHYQKTQTIWRGERGTVVMYQNELPYDPPSQAAWQESSGPGYPAFEVASGVQNFLGYGMGSYSYFNQGQPIVEKYSFRVPQRSGVQLRSLLTVFLNGSGSITHVVNNVGAAATSANGGQANNVVSYP